jgi:lipopolysaccharide export system protein LptC
MTHAAGYMDDFEGSGLPPTRERAAAFDAARRHSRRVSRLKILIVCGSAFAICALAFVSLDDPFGRLPKNVSIQGAALSGTKITMEHPKLTGFKRDGRPYQLLALSGVQDIRSPSVVELNEIDARVTMPDKSVLRLQAPQGVYDTVKDFMRLRRNIRVTSTSGYDARLTSADLDFKAGTIVSQDPVTVITASSTIAADAMSITGNGAAVIFTGDVRSTIASPSKAAAPPAREASVEGRSP